MYIVRAYQQHGKLHALERERFAQLPIRIGRNPLNDICLNHKLVSAFHARIELYDGRLCVVDVGSRNGVRVYGDGEERAVPIPAGQPTDLASAGHRFSIAATFDLTVDVVANDAPHRSSLANGQVLGNWDMAALPSALPGLEAPAPAPESKSIAPCTRFFQIGLDAMALQGLRELAGSLVPGRPLETTGDVARFITKVHDALDTFCRCFVPLRDGYAQFASSLDLQQAASQRSINRSAASVALETAGTPDAVALALLDPRDPSVDAPAAVEGILADLMLHQVALLDGVMQGVRALLDELSPESVEAALEADRRKGLFGAHRARWREYNERFERLSDERQTFSLIFGRQFTDAYRQYWHKQSRLSKTPSATGSP